MGDIFVGTEAVANRVVTRYELQRWYRPLYPNVHIPRDCVPSLRDRTTGAWLWSHRESVVTGVAASALHGAEWIDADIPIELIWDCTRPPRGVIVRKERIADDEITCIAGMPVATPARTAFDLGRYLPRKKALERLDALMHACPFSTEDVLMLTKRYRGARGVAKLKAVLPLVDGGAASPPETRLRLLYIDAGLPRPTTQIAIADEWGRVIRTVDMGWEDFQVASEYDGGQHQTDRAQYIKDLKVLPKLRQLGWDVMQVIKEDREHEVIQRAYTALKARGWGGTLRPAARETAFQHRKFE
ncbi:hypothetical protein BA059_11180 [Mycolicibacterium sp. (ex Dasyatis americana)]|uniref:AbiEi antitoxin C-terminal domain-containing protein n=1 Tax=Mycobacterium syngnathidarum TaxID=1908205 RepID=A0A1S1JYC8_9MYCO|nr:MULTISPECIES: hypothetical protein [Mycobacterium]OFB40007.1 hypothetical protein BA059_11180 [Mycolicibacterium sp. (ex Dasyatis americana)]MCG7608500.1 hypothetical protein [Mycobacterium sp. CnD-18-1]OHT93629.1 hypothetical protein BKG61_21000 [Mycobacterium syngnathidarum]OLT97965.1 hypothetical protein BKG60_02585 [Mycobacterium syngnathidarum]TMS55696.1 hypothetical protein E0T84_00560 [Mycobacterium sp. DBP42]